MVVVAEAQDQDSETKLGEVLRKAQLANVTIYSVGLSTTAAALRAKPNPPAPVHVGLRAPLAYLSPRATPKFQRSSEKCK